MKNYCLFFVLLFTTVFVFSSCNGTKNTDQNSDLEKPLVEDNSECKKLATVLDYTGLDGCTFLLQLEDGKILQPHIGSREIFDFNNFSKAETVSISYINKRMMSTCMKGQMVDIRCCTIVKEGSPRKPEGEF